MSNHELVYSVPPHIKSAEKIKVGMRDVAIALVPVIAVTIYFFRVNAIINIAACVITAVLCEVVMRKIMRKESTLGDFSAIVTGLLLALCLSAATSWWLCIIATIFAVAVVKELMGGLGLNYFNPALMGLAFVLITSRWWAGLSSSWGAAAYHGSIDGVTTATPLTFIKPTALGGIRPGYWPMFLANAGGALGEVSVLALLVGAAYLLYRGQITWHIPASIIATVFILTAILGENPLYMILTGGLMLGAFFMATDWVTSPDGNTAKIVYGVLIGVLIVVFRMYAGSNGGVAFAILIGNAFAPLLTRLFPNKIFGQVKEAG